MAQPSPTISPQLNRHLIVTTLVLVYLISYTAIVLHDWPHFIKKELSGYDEHINVAVAANLTRQIFPTKVRVNSLIEEFNGDWMEGPYWQHIPPLFAYVPLPLYWLDGQVSIETTRLAYSLVTAVTGSLFIIIIYLTTQSIISSLGALITSLIWTATTFTRQLAIGHAFGASDIVLSLTVTLSFGAILWYLEHPRHDRQQYPLAKLCLVATIVSIPILTKNVLGAIPATTFFGLLIWDRGIRRTLIRTIIPFLIFLIILVVYYGALFISSPETFKVEMAVPFQHFGNYEGWSQPWHNYISHYLPNTYLLSFWPLFVSGVLVATHILLTTHLQRRDRLLLYISGGWFAWNVIAVSLVSAKSANFVYQTYLLAIFYTIYPFVVLIKQKAITTQLTTRLATFSQKRPRIATGLILGMYLTATLMTPLSFIAIIQHITNSRHDPYPYVSGQERFYQLGEYAQAAGINANDLFILFPFADDTWLRYYLIFLTGAESRRRDELLQHAVTLDDIRKKYQRILLVHQNNLPQENRPTLPSSRQLAATELYTVEQATPDFQITTIVTANLGPNLTLTNILSDKLP